MSLRPLLLQALPIAALAVFGLNACDSDPPPHPTISKFDVTPAAVKAGEAMQVTVETTDFELVADEEEAHGHATFFHDGESHQGGDSNPNKGHYHLYLDSTETNPLSMPVTRAFNCDVPAGTAAGAHKLILRLHSSDHKIIQPEVVSEFAITVTP